MREIDRLTTERCGISSIELMENAGEAVVRSLERHWEGFSGRRIVVFCGKGNNGGDGAVVARLLAIAGAHIQIILFGRLDETKGDARINFDRLRSWKDENVFRESRQDA